MIVNCHLCGGALTLFEDFELRAQVTSDCRPWTRGGKLALCDRCATVQKPTDQVWRESAESIYRGYVIYDQAAGAEQLVFDAAGGRPRSMHIADALADLLPTNPLEVLDVGCGNGAFLRAMSARFPAARLSGTEFDGRHREMILAIPGAVAFYDGDLGSVSGGYDLISLVHVLEHIIDPVSFLRGIVGMLKPTGRILIEVPDRRKNLFDVLIADHCTHFDSDSLARCCRKAGLALQIATDGIVPKELTFVAYATSSLPDNDRFAQAADIRADVEAQLGWLGGLVLGAAATLADAAPFGIFGTSIAASWLDTELQAQATFFVDEDRSRIGRDWLGRPIIAPAEVPVGAIVYIPLISAIAEQIARRLSGKARYVAPGMNVS